MTWDYAGTAVLSHIYKRYFLTALFILICQTFSNHINREYKEYY